MPQKTFSVFLCHNSVDKPSVEIVARRLQENGVEPWLDRWNLIPGEPWIHAIEKAIRQCSAVAVFFGPASEGRWQSSEEELALDIAISSGGKFPVIPVLLPGAVKGEEHTFLKNRTWVELSTLEDAEGLRRLICGIENREPGPPPTPTGSGDTVHIECPYVGLSSFSAAQASYFFGRAELTAALVERIKTMLPQSEGPRLLGLVGGSGSGKSSLARAGVLHSLREGRGIPGSPDWPILDLTPGNDPVKSLALKLIEFERGPSDAVRLMTTVDSIQSHKEMLHYAASTALNASPQKRLIVLVDQFEEVFSSAADTMRKAFIDNLLWAAQAPGGQTIVLLTLRADFYGNCADHPELAAILPGRHQIVTALADKELREAIELPARAVGCQVEPALVNLLLKQSENQVGSLPTLQFVLFKLWQARKGRQLTLADYLGIGQLDGALDQHAEEVYGAFTSSQQEICKNIMRRLAKPWGDDRFTRRRLSLEAVIPHSGEPAAVKAVEEVVGRLAGPDSRLVTISVPDPANKKAYLEVAHETLIGSWQRFKTWLNADKEFLLWKERMRVNLADWLRYKHDKSCLLHGPVLAEAIHRAHEREGDLDDDEKQFIRNSVNARRRLWIIIGAEAVAAVLIVAGSIAWVSGRMRVQQAITASKGFLAVNPGCAVAAALYADERMKSADSQAVLEQAVQTAASPALEHGGPVYDVSFSPRGDYLATASEDETAVLWNSAGHAAVRLFKMKARVLAIAFSPDGTRLAAGDGNGNLEISSLPDGSPASSLRQDEGVSAIAFKPDGSAIVTGSSSGKVRFWPLGARSPSLSFDAHEAAIGTLVWAPDGRHFATGSNDGTAKIWSVDQTPPLTLKHVPGEVDAIGFRDRGKILLTNEVRGRLRSWETSGGKELSSLESSNSVVHGSLNADGRVLATTYSDGALLIRDSSKQMRVNRPDETITKLALNAPGDQLAVANDLGKVRIYELSRPALVAVGRRELAETREEKLTECARYR